MNLKHFLSGVDVSDSVYILRFYSNLLRQRPLSSILLIFMGFLVRAISVVLFVLVVKVFLSILEPDSTLKILNSMLMNYSDFQLDKTEMPLLLVIILSVLIIVQFGLSKLALALFLKCRTEVVEFLFQRPLSDHVPMHLHICLDKIPLGYDCLIKACEILVFYVFLFSIIFYLYPMAGLLIIIIVPIFLMLMLMKGRKEVFVQAEFNLSRKSVTSLDDDYRSTIMLSNDNYVFGRNNIIYADVLGGASIVTMMVVFILSGAINIDGFGGLAALVLVFGMRFAIMYAGELSRVLSRLLQQRVIADSITHSPF